MQSGKQSGVLISAVDNKLRISPKERVTPDLLKFIQGNKKKIVKYIKEMNKRVGSLPLDEFAISNIAIKVHSKILNEDIYIVSNEALQDQVADEGLVTYLPHELEHLIKHKVTPDVIRKTHVIKKMFLGSKIVQEGMMQIC